MRTEDQQTGKDSRLSRLLRRALLVVGGAIAVAVVTSAPAWADVVGDGMTVTSTMTTTVISSVTDATKADELPSSVLDTGRELVPAPVVPISLDYLALLREAVTELPVLSLAEVRHGDATAPVPSRLALSLDVDQPGPLVSSAPVVRFSAEPVPPSPAISDVIASQVDSQLPVSSIANGRGSQSSTVVPRPGELNGTCHATHKTEAGQLACRTWTSGVRVMSVQVGKQPGRTPD